MTATNKAICAAVRGHADRRAERALKEKGRADVDGAQYGDEAEQVEPGGQPAGEAVAQNGRPVIQAARRRVGGSDLRHGQGEHGGDAQPNIQPMPAPAPPIDDVACANELMPPDRMQMMENEIAKFENLHMLRDSSWA